MILQKTFGHLEIFDFEFFIWWFLTFFRDQAFYPTKFVFLTKDQLKLH